MSYKSSALSILFEGGEHPCSFDPTDIAAKKPQPLCERKEGWNGGGVKENLCPFAHNAKV